jgi:hypothetical protein
MRSKITALSAVRRWNPPIQLSATARTGFRHKRKPTTQDDLLDSKGQRNKNTFHTQKSDSLDGLQKNIQISREFDHQRQEQEVISFIGSTQP